VAGDNQARTRAPKAGIHDRRVLVIEVFPGLTPPRSLLRDLNREERKLLLAAAGHPDLHFWARNTIAYLFDHPTPLLLAAERHERILPTAVRTVVEHLTNDPKRADKAARLVRKGHTPREATTHAAGPDTARTTARILGRTLGYIQSDPLTIALTLQVLGVLLTAPHRLRPLTHILVVIPELKHLNIHPERLARRVYSTLYRALRTLDIPRHLTLRVYLKREDGRLEDPRGEPTETFLVEAYEELFHHRPHAGGKHFPPHDRTAHVTAWAHALARALTDRVRRDLHRRGLRAAQRAKQRGEDPNDAYQRERNKWLKRWFRRGRAWLKHHRPAPTLSRLSAHFVLREAGTELLHTPGFLARVTRTTLRTLLRAGNLTRIGVRQTVRRVARKLVERFQPTPDQAKHILKLLRRARRRVLGDRTLLEAFGTPSRLEALARSPPG